MTPDQQRIAIAKSRGLRLDRPATGWHDLGCQCRECHPLPDYLNDFNAIFEAIKALPHEQKTEVVQRIGWSATRQTLDLSFIADATALQWSTAYVKTLNLWKP